MDTTQSIQRRSNTDFFSKNDAKVELLVSLAIFIWADHRKDFECWVIDKENGRDETEAEMHEMAPMAQWTWVRGNSELVWRWRPYVLAESLVGHNIEYTDDQLHWTLNMINQPNW